MDKDLNKAFEGADRNSPFEGPVRVELLHILYRLNEPTGSDNLGRKVLCVFDPATMTLPDMVEKMQDAVIKNRHEVLAQERPSIDMNTKFRRNFKSEYAYEVKGIVPGLDDGMDRYGTVAELEGPFARYETETNDSIRAQIAHNLTREAFGYDEKLFATTFGQFFKPIAAKPKEELNLI